MDDERRLFTMLMSREDRQKLEMIQTIWSVPLATIIRICIHAGYEKLGFAKTDPLDDLKNNITDTQKSYIGII